MILPSILMRSSQELVFSVDSWTRSALVKQSTYRHCREKWFSRTPSDWSAQRSQTKHQKQPSTRWMATTYTSNWRRMTRHSALCTLSCRTSRTSIPSESTRATNRPLSRCSTPLRQRMPTPQSTEDCPGDHLASRRENYTETTLKIKVKTWGMKCKCFFRLTLVAFCLGESQYPSIHLRHMLWPIRRGSIASGATWGLPSSVWQQTGMSHLVWKYLISSSIH